jgi:hypothetical protein
MRRDPPSGMETTEENEAQIIEGVRQILVPAAGMTSALDPFAFPTSRVMDA